MLLIVNVNIYLRVLNLVQYCSFHHRRLVFIYVNLPKIVLWKRSRKENFIRRLMFNSNSCNSFNKINHANNLNLSTYKLTANRFERFHFSGTIEPSRVTIAREKTAKSSKEIKFKK